MENNTKQTQMLKQMNSDTINSNKIQIHSLQNENELLYDQVNALKIKINPSYPLSHSSPNSPRPEIASDTAQRFHFHQNIEDPSFGFPSTTNIPSPSGQSVQSQMSACFVNQNCWRMEEFQFDTERTDITDQTDGDDQKLERFESENIELSQYQTRKIQFTSSKIKIHRDSICSSSSSESTHFVSERKRRRTLQNLDISGLATFESFDQFRRSLSIESNKNSDIHIVENIEMKQKMEKLEIENSKLLQKLKKLQIDMNEKEEMEQLFEKCNGEILSGNTLNKLGTKDTVQIEYNGYNEQLFEKCHGEILSENALNKTKHFEIMQSVSENIS